MLQMFLRSDVAEQIGRLYKLGAKPTDAQHEAFRAARAARPKYAARLQGATVASSSDPDNYAVVGDVAQISIAGVLTEAPDFWAWWMGIEQTCYKDIRDGLALAAANPLVKSVLLDINSPGGYCDGLFDTLAALEAFDRGAKAVSVQASQACSAAYAIAAMGGKITALGPASEFGSVGVLQVYTFDADTEIVNVTSTEAPNKRPDPRTAEGKAVIVAELDAVHELFADSIARGRTSATGETYTVADVNTDFGRGATLLASAAFDAGMIDKKPKAPKRSGSKAEADEADEPVELPEKVAAANPGEPAPAPPAPAASAPSNPSPPRVTGHETRKKKMNEAELRAQHPELFAAVLQQGVTQERDRVEAHLIMGEASGDMPTAMAAITAGEAMTPKLSAKYQAAGMKRTAQAARQTETDAAGNIVAGATPAPGDGGKDLQDTVAEMMAKARGKTAA